MRLQQVLDDLLEMLEAEDKGKHFKTLGALHKSLYQNDKSEDEIFIRSDMYSKTIGDPEAGKKISTTLRAWHQIPENKEKFNKAIIEREIRNKKKKKEKQK